MGRRGKGARVPLGRLPILNTRADCTLATLSEKPKQVLKKAVKKRQVEINVKRATTEVKAMVANAKMTEVNIWMHNEVCQAALRQAAVKPMKIRWHLIMKDEGKVKAMIILLGSQVPRPATIETSSPTISPRG